MLLASIAMEESGCNKDTIGGAGEQGIMQITKDKCPNQTANAAWYAGVYLLFGI
jgi:membrane-bound lytic murein transglycosylase MltF